jgi:hypothetical protein
MTPQTELNKAINAVGPKTELDGKAQRTVSSDLLTKAVLLDVTWHCWTNRAKAEALPESNSRAAKAQANQDLRTTMRLIKSPALDAIVTRTNETKAWVMARCMPSYLVNGIQFVKLVAVEEFEREMDALNKWLKDEGVPALQQDWPRAKAQAKIDYQKMAEKLGIANPYNEAKYPDPADLPGKFGVTHAWVTFGVPQSLPDELRERESIKIAAKYEAAADEIYSALLTGFSDVVAHAVGQMVRQPGEPKKVIKEALVVNFREFCETLRFRNFNDDSQLDDLINQAEQIMSGVSASTLRDRPRARAQVVAQLSTIKAAIDSMIATAPRRKIDLDALDE